MKYRVICVPINYCLTVTTISCTSYTCVVNFVYLAADEKLQLLTGRFVWTIKLFNPEKRMLLIGRFMRPGQ